MPAYYASKVSDLPKSDSEIRSIVMDQYSFDRHHELKVLQWDSWGSEFQILRKALGEIPGTDDWGLALEFVIPRRQSRADAILLVGQAIAVLEFKSEQVDSSAAEQVEDYALDLLDFHKPSSGAKLYPLVVGADRTRRKRKTRLPIVPALEATRFTTYSDLAQELAEIARIHSSEPQRDLVEWERGDYFPVPSIVEAALGLFRDMHVDEIARSEADPINLRETVERLKAIIQDSSTRKRKAICFVTGVPGAGKTLAGLKLVHDAHLREDVNSQIAFLSGNGPLVEVLQGALTKDLRRRNITNRRSAKRQPKTLIQSVYGVKKHYWPIDSAPVEHVWIFDEAQRAWDQKRTAEKLGERNGLRCPYAEAGLLMSFLDRHTDWAVLVCLIGGGQEIHTGEAGLSEWGKAIQESFSTWAVFASPEAIEGNVGAGQRLFEGSAASVMTKVEVDDRLHLSIPTRQYRGTAVSSWVDAVIAGDAQAANRAKERTPKYPIMITRSLEEAKTFLRNQRSGSERYGLVASSGAKRLRADGIFVPSANGSDAAWFLANEGDIRSSFQMEVAATEFQVQGLEIDWAAVCWEGDFVWKDEWCLRSLVGSKWNLVNKKNEAHRQYVRNTYRVLLTRARQGMVLYLPEGSIEDRTREPLLFDQTFRFLISCGAKPLRREVLPSEAVIS